MGNVAGNTLICAESILRANRLADDNWTMRAVAVGIATFACALHAIWRKGGVYVNNAFGFVKILMLLALFFIGAAYVGGQFHGSADTANENLNIGTSTANASSSAYDYAQAFLAILFSFGGFHQANYVRPGFCYRRNEVLLTALRFSVRLEIAVTVSRLPA